MPRLYDEKNRIIKESGEVTMKIIFGLFIWLLMFGFVSITQAAPLYYSFTSEISSTYINSGFDYGYSIGDIISHTVLIDDELDGYITFNDGSVSVTQDNLNADYYYAELISGDIMTYTGSLYQISGFSDPSWIDSYNYGRDTFSNFTTEYIVGSYVDGVIAFQPTHDFGRFINNLTDGNEIITDQVYFTFLDVQISTTPPSAVPIPSPLILIFSGLVTLIGASRKWANKTLNPDAQNTRARIE